MTRFFNILFLMPSAFWALMEPSFAFSRDSFEDVFEIAAPSVVNIWTTGSGANTSIDPFFEYFFDNFGEKGGFNKREATGSGVILTPNGLVVTNEHVIRDMDDIMIVLKDGTEYKAKVVSEDKKHDLAILQIEKPNRKFKAIKFADLGNAKVGQVVLAIGNPLGIGQTATIGILSAVFRALGNQNDNIYLQTDAAINPGNSGGALINIKGELIGINVLKLMGGDKDNIGFAIPVDLVKKMLMRVQGKLKNAAIPWPSFIGQTTNQDIAVSGGLKSGKGVIISKLYPSGSAERAGLRIGDIITAVDGNSINNITAVKYHIAVKNVGDKIEVLYTRKGKNMKAMMVLEAPPSKPSENRYTITVNNPLRGTVVANLSPKLAESMGLNVWSGVVVVEAPKMRFFNSPVQEGYLITRLNDTKIENVAQLKAAIKKYESAKRWIVGISGGGRTYGLDIVN